MHGVIDFIVALLPKWIVDGRRYLAESSYSELSYLSGIQRHNNMAGKWNVLSLLAFRHLSACCRMIITEGDGRHLFKKLDGIEGESPESKGFENQIKLIVQPQPTTKRGPAKPERTYIGGLTLTKASRSCYTRGLYRHYCNGKR